MAYVIEWDRKINGLPVGGYDKVKIVVDNDGVNSAALMNIVTVQAICIIAVGTLSPILPD